jgi:hypothetical protein
MSWPFRYWGLEAIPVKLRDKAAMISRMWGLDFVFILKEKSLFVVINIGICGRRRNCRLGNEYL